MPHKRFLNAAPITLVLLFALTFATGYTQVSKQGDTAQWNSYLPSGKGQELLKSLCTTCHDLGRIVKQRRESEQWQQTVQGMLTALDPRYSDYLGEDAEQLTQYLSQYLGPLSPAYETLESDAELREKYLKGGIKSIININKAGVGELMRLPGIGRNTAQLIIKYREDHGLFKSGEDLKKLGEINEEQFRKIRVLITVD